MFLNKLEKEKLFIKKYNLIDFMKYDSLFKIEIKFRGDKIYKANKIKNYVYKNDIASCVVKGNSNYDVSIEFDKEDNIKKTNCTCPYFETGDNCKHIYALLIKSKLEDNYDKLYRIQKESYNELIDSFKKIKDYFKKNLNFYTKKDIERINDMISYYKNNRISRIDKILSSDLNQSALLNIIIDIQDDNQSLEEEFNEIKELENNIIYNSKSKKTKNKTHYIPILFGLLINSKKTKPKQKNYSCFSEKEMDNYGLEGWQKDLVKKGYIAPWNFDDKDGLEKED